MCASLLYDAIPLHTSRATENLTDLKRPLLNQFSTEVTTSKAVILNVDIETIIRGAFLAGSL